MGEQIDMIFT